MKKILMIASVLIGFGSAIQAQNTMSGGFRRAGTNAQTKAMQRQKLQDSLGITTDQSKKVDAIQQDFMLKMRAVNMDTKLTATEKKTRLDELKTERKTKLKGIITNQQLAKMDGQIQKKTKPVYHKKRKPVKA